MMLYVLYPRTDLGWDDPRIFTSFAQVEPLIDQDNFAIAYEGTDELTPVWIFQLEKGKITRWAVSR
jgi:hypothetical protein